MPSAAESLLPLIQQLCGGQPPLRIRCWDGSEISTAACGVCAGDGEPQSDAAIVIKSPVALRRILWQPNELGFSRAYVAGEIEVEGGIWPLFQLQALLSHDDRPNGLKARLEAGRRLFAAVAEHVDPGAWAWYAGLDPDEVAKNLTKNKAYPVDLDAWWEDGKLRFCVIMYRDSKE